MKENLRKGTKEKQRQKGARGNNVLGNYYDLYKYH